MIQYNSISEYAKFLKEDYKAVQKRVSRGKYKNLRFIKDNSGLSVFDLNNIEDNILYNNRFKQTLNYTNSVSEMPANNYVSNPILINNINKAIDDFYSDLK